MLIKTKHGPVDNFMYRDLPAIQVWGVMDAFTELSKTHKFKYIVEFGTDYGGLTNALADNPISDGAQIHTYDINTAKFKNYHPDKIIFHHLDIYNNWNKIANSDFFENSIKKDEYILFLCDGGDKKHEYEKVKDMLAIGDCIMVHDYFPNQEAFAAANGRWNWWEFDDNHTKYPQLKKTVDYFDNYAWFFREYV